MVLVDSSTSSGIRDWTQAPSSATTDFLSIPSNPKSGPVRHARLRPAPHPFQPVIPYYTPPPQPSSSSRGPTHQSTEWSSMRPRLNSGSTPVLGLPTVRIASPGYGGSPNVLNTFHTSHGQVPGFISMPNLRQATQTTAAAPQSALPSPVPTSQVSIPRPVENLRQLSKYPVAKELIVLSLDVFVDSIYQELGGAWKDHDEPLVAERFLRETATEVSGAHTDKQADLAESARLTLEPGSSRFSSVCRRLIDAASCSGFEPLSDAVADFVKISLR